MCIHTGQEGRKVSKLSYSGSYCNLEYCYNYIFYTYVYIDSFFPRTEIFKVYFKDFLESLASYQDSTGAFHSKGYILQKAGFFHVCHIKEDSVHIAVN